MILLLPSAPAAAHNSLLSTSPAQDARLTSAPTEVTLGFLEALKPTFTTIVLSEGDTKVPTGKPVIAGPKVTLPLTGTLPNGTYTVAYRVVSADGHPVQGSYRFTVADPDQVATPDPVAATATPAAAAPSPSAAAASAHGSADDTGRTVSLIAGGALAVLAVGALVALRRRRPHN
ncbi:copper resistance protein CopC [Micromonospora sp. MS34]|uniref:copper resistance CopC family protein n=1 Tax=Micromonospora sp. MS34 TaxID=3385971 RepID=UPI0039A0BABC